MILKKDIIEYKKNGIIKINSFISNSETSKIIKFIRILFINFLKKKNITKNYENLSLEKIILTLKKNFPMEYKKIIATTMQRCPIVLKIGQSDKVIKTLKRLNIYNPIFSTDPLIMLHSDFVQEKNYAPFHQDWRSIQGSLNNIVIWVPLVDVKKNMNSIEYIESSHLNGLAPTIKDKWFRKIKKIKTTTKDIKSINISKGDAFIFSSFLIHRSGINTSNFIRVSLQYRYNDLEDSYFINNGYPYPYEYAKPNDKLIIKKLPSKKQIRKKFKL